MLTHLLAGFVTPGTAETALLAAAAKALEAVPLVARIISREMSIVETSMQAVGRNTIKTEHVIRM